MEPFVSRLSGFVLLLTTISAGGLDTARLLFTNGAPRILIDDQPVRARMFWGAQSAGTLPLTPAGGETGFDFSPTEDEPTRATLHFRFGQQPGEVVIDDLHVTDLTTGQEVFAPMAFEDGTQAFRRAWHIWPPGDQNTVGTVDLAAGRGRDASTGLRIRLRQPAGEWPDFHLHHEANLGLLRGHRYRVSLWARAEPARALTVAFYRPGQPYVFLGGPPGPFESQIRLAGAAGAPFVSFPIDTPWPPPGQAPDWRAVESRCREVLAANPQALLVPRIGIDAPAWWLDAHPDEVMRWDDGAHGRRIAVPGEVYVRDAAARLEELIRHLESTFGTHIAGYHPVGQNTGEWFYEDTWRGGLNGYAPADRREWRRWLAQRHGTDEALRAAWADPSAALATADVPAPAARRAAPNGLLRDPAREQPLIDFARFQQDLMAGAVCALARAARTASGGRKLVLFFYGYVFEFGPVHNGAATAGHYALRRVLDCPDIDILCSPISYFDRGPGQGAPAMTAAESVALAGKMWLYEDDTHTYLATGTPPGSADHVATADATRGELLRNTAQCALRNFATWWMDLGASGWFDDPELWTVMRDLHALDEPLLQAPVPFQPDVAAVVDESAVPLAAGSGLTTPLLYEIRRPLGRMGAPYGQYLLDDVAAGRVPAKMLVFLNAWSLPPARREALRAATRGKLRIWCHAPDATAGDLTGLTLRKLSGVPAWAEPTAAGRALGLREGFGQRRPLDPLYTAAATRPEEVLATYADGSPAVVMRRGADGIDLFVGPPTLTSDLLRLAARAAGVHLFTETDCNVYANGPYLVLHGATNAPVVIQTGRKGPTRDLFTRTEVGQGPTLTLPLHKNETRVLVMDPQL